jgi:hypothetical protein
MTLLRGHRRRQLVTAAVVAATLAVFALQWSRAPRVEASAAVTQKLPQARGELYLGKTFEGLALRTVTPFLYSDCEPGKRKTAPVKCTWVKVVDGRVTGGDASQVRRARAELHRVG